VFKTGFKPQYHIERGRGGEGRGGKKERGRKKISAPRPC
jgi:hypothetical protein